MRSEVSVQIHDSRLPQGSLGDCWLVVPLMYSESIIPVVSLISAQVSAIATLAEKKGEIEQRFYEHV